MKIRTIFFALGGLLIFAHGAESGAAVSKVRTRKNPHVKMHVQVPQPRLEIVQQPFIEGQRAPLQDTKSLAKQAPINKTPESVYQSQVLSSAKPVIQQSLARAHEADDKNSVSLGELLKSLRDNSQAWLLIDSVEDKQIVVQEFIERFRRQNVVINKSSAYYADFIDEISHRNPQMLQMPFEQILQLAAVMEYDFDNGQDKDILAQKILGSEIYEKNKIRQSAQQGGGQAAK